LGKSLGRSAGITRQIRLKERAIGDKLAVTGKTSLNQRERQRRGTQMREENFYISLRNRGRHVKSGGKTFFRISFREDKSSSPEEREGGGKAFPWGRVSVQGASLAKSGCLNGWESRRRGGQTSMSTPPNLDRLRGKEIR